MNLNLSLIVEQVVDIPYHVDIELVEEWWGTPLGDDRDAAIRSYIESDRDFPTDSVLDNIELHRTVSGGDMQVTVSRVDVM